MLLSLHTTLLLTWTTSAVAGHGDMTFQIGRRIKPDVSRKPSPNKVTTNILTLQRGDTSSQSAEYLAAIRQGRNRSGLYSRVQTSNTSILAVQGGSVYLAPIAIGGQSFKVVIDTGSSDTWLVDQKFTCLNPTTGVQRPESECAFGPSYNTSSTANVIPDENFNISYADGEFLNGAMIRENITLANIAVSQQQMGLVDYAAWYGDTVSSGLVGLAYPLLTNAYPGPDPKKDDAGSYIVYDPLFTTMWKRNQTLPIFSLAMQRGDPYTLQSNGGVLAIGGIPDIKHGTYFASAAIEISRVDSQTGEAVYQFYTITVDGWAYSSKSSVIFDTRNTSNPRYTPLVRSGDNTVIVDSGTSLIYAPEIVASELAALFLPPATLDSGYGLYTVACDAKAPAFGVAVGKKVFYVNPVDLIIQAGGGVCVMGVQGNNGGYTILGDVFLRNTLAVFDIGAAEVRFAAREFTSAGA